MAGAESAGGGGARASSRLKMAWFSRSRHWGVWCLRLLLGGVFVWASIDKILHPLSFALIVEDYRLLPASCINLCAVALPWIELLLGLCLITGFWLVGAVALANTLLVVFLGALVFNVARGLDVHCGCFTSDTLGDPKTAWYLIRDVVFVVMGGSLFYNVLKEERT